MKSEFKSYICVARPQEIKKETSFNDSDKLETGNLAIKVPPLYSIC